VTTASRSGSLAAPQRKPFALAFRIVDGKGQTVRDFDVEHIVMLLAMAGVMLLRPEEYIHHHGEPVAA